MAKILHAKMSLNILKSECTRKGWRLPTHKEVLNVDTGFDFWVSDTTDIELHGRVYDHKTKKLYTMHVMSILGCVVIKNKKRI